MIQSLKFGQGKCSLLRIILVRLLSSYSSSIFSLILFIFKKYGETYQTLSFRGKYIGDEKYENANALIIMQLFWDNNVPLDTPDAKGKNVLHLLADACPKYQKLVRPCIRDFRLGSALRVKVSFLLP